MCDRTSEFHKLVTLTNGSTEKRIPPDTDKPSADIKSRAAFHQLTLDISKGIHDSSLSLSKLTKLVKQQGLFDDPTEEINKIIYKVKQDLNELNFKCDAAQQNVDERKKSYSDNTQVNAHSTSVVSQLKSSLMSATKDFKTALEIRSSKMKDTQSRKNQISGVGMLSPMRQLAQQVKGGDGNTAEKSSSSAALPTPYTRQSVNVKGGANGVFSPYEESSNNAFASPQRGNQHQDQQQHQLLLAPPVSVQYYESREMAVNEVEKTIGELGTLFKRLGSMLMEQQELVERIDEDVENAVSTADKAQTLLQKQYEAVSSNRALYTKLISILLLFIVFFAIFLM